MDLRDVIAIMAAIIYAPHSTDKNYDPSDAAQEAVNVWQAVKSEMKERYKEVLVP